jgi:energy-coupling factor transport system substrate-specific component
VSVPVFTRTHAIRLHPRSTVFIAIASVIALLAFTWPFFVSPGSTVNASTIAPLLYGAAMLLSLAIVLAEVAEGGMDAKALALLGVLAAIGAALRPLSAGTAGVELIFFLLVLGGRALGPGFGFVLGCTTLFASALITAGVGPWMPYQMFACAMVGLGAGLLPPATGRKEIWMLVAYGAGSAFLYGLLLNLSFWPFAIGEGTDISYVAGAGVLENLHRYLLFDATTSLGWDTGRAITNGLLIVFAGPPVLAALRRAARRAAFVQPEDGRAPDTADSRHGRRSPR